MNQLIKSVKKKKKHLILVLLQPDSHTRYEEIWYFSVTINYWFLWYKRGVCYYWTRIFDDNSFDNYHLCAKLLFFIILYLNCSNILFFFFFIFNTWYCYVIHNSYWYWSYKNLTPFWYATHAFQCFIRILRMQYN